MTNAHLIVRGKTVSGIAITFSRPMAPASVENFHNYAVTKPGHTVTDWLSRQSAVLPAPSRSKPRYTTLQCTRSP